MNIYIYINPPLFFRLIGRSCLKVQKHRVLVFTSFFDLRLPWHFKRPWKGILSSGRAPQKLQSARPSNPGGSPPSPNWIQFRRGPENRPPKGWTKLPRRSSEHLNLDPEAPKTEVLGTLFCPSWRFHGIV